jgi:hypothetical protein
MNTQYHSNYDLYLMAFNAEQEAKQELENAEYALKVYTEKVRLAKQEVNEARAERWKAEARFVAHG